jgi:hypothetical protein
VRPSGARPAACSWRSVRVRCSAHGSPVCIRGARTKPLCWRAWRGCTSPASSRTGKASTGAIPTDGSAGCRPPSSSAVPAACHPRLQDLPPRRRCWKPLAAAAAGGAARTTERRTLRSPTSPTGPMCRIGKRWRSPRRRSRRTAPTGCCWPTAKALPRPCTGCWNSGAGPPPWPRTCRTACLRAPARCRWSAPGVWICRGPAARTPMVRTPTFWSAASPRCPTDCWPCCMGSRIASLGPCGSGW